MKSIIYAWISLLLLSSCSGKFSLQKRRYNKGFYFAGSHSVKKQEIKNNEGKPPINARPSTEKTEVVTKEPAVSEKATSVLSPKTNLETTLARDLKKPGEDEITSNETLSNPVGKEITAFPSASAESKSNLDFQSSRHDGGEFLLMILAVSLGGLLGAILVFLYLLTMYPLGTAVIIFLLVLLIASLLGGGAYLGIGF